MKTQLNLGNGEIEMKEILNWIVRKDDEIIEYVKGTREAVELYLKELHEKDTDNDSDYDAVGCESEFNKKIKFKILTDKGKI